MGKDSKAEVFSIAKEWFLLFSSILGLNSDFTIVPYYLVFMSLVFP